MKKIRNGRSVKTIIHDAFQHHVFHEIDNLDTKSQSEALDNYEKVFITVRDELEHAQQYCCDDQEDRLAIAQIIADALKYSQLIRRG